MMEAMDRKVSRVWAMVVLAWVSMGALSGQAEVTLDSASTTAGYISRILLNEVPFPGEHGFVSESDTKAAMLSVLCVLHNRIDNIPAGYKQRQLASVETSDILDIITAGGVHGQCDGFYRDSSGRPVMVSRVDERLDNLMRIAGEGKPGRFASLLNYGKGLAAAYAAGGMSQADRFVALQRVGSIPVTGRAYSWMSDKDYYNPGGNFVKIPDQQQGSLGGNRFFTLKRLVP